MPDASLPDDLVALQRTVYASQAATYSAGDADREELRAAERDAVLALHRHPAYRDVNWRPLREAALADESTPAAT